MRFPFPSDLRTMNDGIPRGVIIMIIIIIIKRINNNKNTPITCTFLTGVIIFQSVPGDYYQGDNNYQGHGYVQAYTFIYSVCTAYHPNEPIGQYSCLKVTLRRLPLSINNRER